MPNVFDVSEYILQKTDAITTWKLQKLVYYSKAWQGDASLGSARYGPANK